MTRDQLADAVIGGSALLAVLLFAVDGGGVIRIAVATVFLLLGPGLAFVRLLCLRDAMAACTLAIGFSIGLNVVMGTLLLAVRQWSPGRMVAIMVIFTLVCLWWRHMQGVEAAVTDGMSARQRAMAALAGTDAHGGDV